MRWCAFKDKVASRSGNLGNAARAGEVAVSAVSFPLPSVGVDEILAGRRNYEPPDERPQCCENSEDYDSYEAVATSIPWRLREHKRRCLIIEGGWLAHDYAGITPIGCELLVVFCHLIIVCEMAFYNAIE